MKRIILLVIILCVALTCFVSCDKSNSEPFISVKMTKFNPWLESASTSDIVMIEEINDRAGVAPGTAIICYHTDKEEVISEYLNRYRNMKLTPNFDFSAIGGGTSTRIVFTFADGSTEEIVFSAKGFVGGNLFTYNTYSDSKIDKSKMEYSYCFKTYDSGYKVYEYENNLQPVKEAESGAEKFRFVPYSVETGLGVVPRYYIETEYGKITVYTDNLCYLETEFKGGDSYKLEDGFYKLVGVLGFDEICGQ